MGNGKALEGKGGEEYVALCGARTEQTEAGAWARCVSVMPVWFFLTEGIRQRSSWCDSNCVVCKILWFRNSTAPGLIFSAIYITSMHVIFRALDMIICQHLIFFAFF